MAGLWGFVVIAGPVILLAAIVGGWLLNRKSRIPESVTEQATRQRKLDDAAEEKAQNLR